MTTPLRMPRNKKQVPIRLDADILDWFNRQGRDYQRHINNAVFRIFIGNRSRGSKFKVQGSGLKTGDSEGDE